LGGIYKRRVTVDGKPGLEKLRKDKIGLEEMKAGGAGISELSGKCFFLILAFLRSFTTNP